MPVFFELHQQRRDVAAHILLHLASESVAIDAMRMPYNRTWFVRNRHSSSQHPIPKFRVFAATGGACAKTLIEKANPAEHAPAESHVCARPNSPDRDPPVEHVIKEKRVESDRTVAAVEAAEVHFETDLCLGFQLRCKHQSSSPGYCV